MILDKQLMFDEALAITATAASTNQIDLSVYRDLGVGDDPALKVLAQVITAFVSAGGATLQIQFQGSRDNVTYTTMAESRAYAVADLTAGIHLLPIDVPRIGGAAQSMPRYYRLNYVVGTSTFSAGTLTAGLVLDRQDSNVQLGGYPAGVVITT